MSSGQTLHYPHAVVGMVENRMKQSLKLITKLGIGSKEQCVDILCQTIRRIEQVHVERYAAHHHIRLCHIVSRQFDASASVKGLTLSQRERSEFHLPRKPSVESSLVAYQIVEHPRCCRTAHHKQEIVTGVAPSIPESLQSREKSRPCCVHPWQFVDKHYLATTIVGDSEILFEQEKCFHPRFRHGYILHAMAQEREIEVLQLGFHRHLAPPVIRR